MPRTVSSPGPKSHGFYGRRSFQEAQVDEAEGLDARGNLPDLLFRVSPRVARICLEICDGGLLDPHTIRAPWDVLTSHVSIPRVVDHDSRKSPT